MSRNIQWQRTIRPTVATCIGALLCLVVSGCAGANSNAGPVNPSLPIGLPTAPPPASSNVFAGTQGPGLWTLSVDDTQERFSYQAVTYSTSLNAATAGIFLPVAGFISLSSNGVPTGYGVEVPGRAIWLQPGNDTVAPVFAVQQDSCFPINGNVRFQFVSMPNPLSNLGPEYGSLEAQTTTDGSSWTFGGQAQYVVPYTIGTPGFGNQIQPGTIDTQTSNLGVFPASCRVTNGQAEVVSAPNVSSPAPSSKIPTRFVIGPTGFFFEDQSTGTQTQNTADAFSLVGVIQPLSPLQTQTVVATKYVGFLREAYHGQAPVTRPIGFGQVVAGSGASMTGGTFLNDDITQFQNSNIIINLGMQDIANNGLYSLASITVPDPTNVCFVDPSTNHNGVKGGLPGVDQYGNETCTFNGVAVVGNPENKYAIFVIASDVVSGLPMGIYLFQQQ